MPPCPVKVCFTPSEMASVGLIAKCRRMGLNQTMTQMDPILTLDGVSLTRPGKTLLSEVSATVAPGEVIVITGPSGSGKTSLLRLLNRLDDPTQGRVLFQGRDMRTYPPGVLRQRIGLVFQTPVVFPGTVLENLQQVDRLNKRSVSPVSVYAEKLAQVGLSQNLLAQAAASLSLGEKQRFAVARTLLNNPEVLLLDEPTSALDPEAAAYLLQAIQALHQATGITILLVTHQAAHGLQIATHQWVLEAGRLVDDHTLWQPMAGGQSE